MFFLGEYDLTKKNPVPLNCAPEILFSTFCGHFTDRGFLSTQKLARKNYKVPPIKMVTNKAIMAYNSGNTAKIMVLLNKLCPPPIPLIPSAQIFD